MTTSRKGRSRSAQRPKVTPVGTEPTSSASPTSVSAARLADPPTRSPRGGPSPTSSRSSALPSALAGEPRFWFGFEVAWAKLVTARIVIFTLLAIDAFLQIGHAPRYGAGGFNVAQLPGFDVIAPGRAGYEIGQLLDGYLLALAACGVATRLVVPLAAAVYGWLYFGSQLDSYQHHYLMFLVIAIASFVPWQRPDGATPSTPIRTWAVRLILCQLAVLYVWAAISKLDLAWLDGRTLGNQLVGGLRTLIDRTIGMKATAVMVVLAELTLAATVWSKRAARFAAPLGIAFHAGIIATKLEIGMFAYLMLGMYAFVVPDGVLVFLVGDGSPGPVRRAIAWVRDRRSWIAWALSIVVGVALASRVHLENPLVAALAASLIPLGLGVYALARRSSPPVALAIAHAVAIAGWLVLDRASSTAVDYYRFWGSSERKLGTPDAAEHAYRRLTAIAPDDGNGHFQLGRTLVTAGKLDAGLAELHIAERIEPTSARAYLVEARALAKEGKREAAIAAARAGVAAEPSSAMARALVTALGAGVAPAAGSADDAP